MNVGDLVSCYADLLNIGETSIHYHIEVWTLSAKREHSVKVAEGTFIYVAIDEEGNKRLIPKEKK